VLNIKYHQWQSFLLDRDKEKYYGSVSPVLHLLKNKKDIVAAEIGVFRGKSTLAMLECWDVKKIYLIDPFCKEAADDSNKLDTVNKYLDEELYQETRSRVENHVRGSNAIWVREKSSLAACEIPDGELDFIFIDGAHDYESVLNDIQLYYPKVKSGGIIAGDDFTNRYNRPQNFGVVEAVNTAFWDLGYREINAYKHKHKPEDYYSTFAMIKE